MKKLNIKGKEFKIIPETKLVVGEKRSKIIGNDFIYGIKETERKMISAAGNALNIICDTYNWSEIPVVRANAYCDERDEWDEKRGIEVCASKLDMKNHRRLAKQYSRIYRLLVETANTVYKLCKLHLDKANAIEEDLVRHFGRMEV